MGDARGGGGGGGGGAARGATFGGSAQLGAVAAGLNSEVRPMTTARVTRDNNVRVGNGERSIQLSRANEDEMIRRVGGMGPGDTLTIANPQSRVFTSMNVGQAQRVRRSILEARRRRG